MIFVNAMGNISINGPTRFLKRTATFMPWMIRNRDKLKMAVDYTMVRALYFISGRLPGPVIRESEQLK